MIPPHERIPNKLLREAFCQHLMSWRWEWFATLTYSQECFYGPDAAKGLLLRWTRKLCTSEHIQVGYFFVLTSTGFYVHAHLLMLGQGGKGETERTLLDVKRRRWVRAWPCRANIEIPSSIEKTSLYMSSHAYNPVYDWVVPDFYNLKLLKKCKHEGNARSLARGSINTIQK